VARSLDSRRTLLVTDRGLEHVGHPQRAERILRESGIEVTVFDDVHENPSERDVQAGVEVVRRAGADLIVAIGGGSAMDCAKGINFLLTNGGRMIDYKGHNKATKPMLPSIGVPTTAGTGSEAQSYALISDDETGLKMACGDKKAAFRISILDPDLTLTQPRLVTAVTGIDAIAHAIESYVCTAANPISRMASRAAFEYLDTNFERVLADPNDRPARAAMQIGAHLAGMAIENAMLGVCHSCANPLTARFKIIHGTAIGIMLPHVIRWNAAAVGPAYQTLNGRPADALAQRVADLARAAGLPGRLKEAGVDHGMLKVMAEEANQQWTARYNPRPVTADDCRALYEAAW
jgi:alcohol dehydrogenase